MSLPDLGDVISSALPAGRGSATAGLLRALNNRAALDLLLEHGRLSRVDVATLTGVSKPTASALLTRLEASGHVVCVGTSEGRPGPGAQLYELNPRAGHAVGVDVVPGRLSVAVADLTGRVVGQADIPMPRRQPAGPGARLEQAIDQALATAGLHRRHVGHVVLATPGAYDRRAGQLRYAKHLSGWHEPNLADRLQERLSLPVSLDNDVNLAALAEQRLGAARGYADFVYFWADEGIGAAVVLGGRLHRGATGGAGEIGFMPVPGAALLRQVTREGSGGFEQLAGGVAVRELGRLHGLTARTPAEVVRRAVRTPGAGEELLAELATRYATGIASVVSVVDPGVVFLGGPTLGAGGERLRELLEREVGQLAIAHTPVRLSTVTNNPVLTGAVHAALDAVREQVFTTA